jgi:HAD superfamily hydrolase (TIGR01484 family)
MKTRDYLEANLLAFNYNDGNLYSSLIDHEVIMRYHVFATDFDGTIAHNSIVSEKTRDALKRLVASGRQLILVTGRELPDLKILFSELKLFRWVVAENGGLLFEPSTNKEWLLSDSPSEDFIAALRIRGVTDLSVGKSIIATWSPFEQIVLETIRELGLEMQVIFNKGAVMILPAGINKAFGLQRALKELNLSMHNTVGVGDAENDHSFLRAVEFSAAVSNALSSLKESVDLVLPLDHGDGVAWLIDQILADDLASLAETVQRFPLVIAKQEDNDVCLPSFGGPTLICGASGSGKSTLANRVVDAIDEQSYQFCLIDPEGDYESFEGAVVLGGPTVVPQIEEALHVLEQPDVDVVVCLTGVPIPDRPAFFLKFLAGFMQLRTEKGRPHWLILDEAHHLLPADWVPSNETVPSNWTNVILITVQPSLLPPCLLQQVETVAIVGKEFHQSVDDFALVTDVTKPILKEPRWRYSRLESC